MTLSPSTAADRRLPPQVILLGFVSLLNDSASEMIYPLLPVFLTAVLGAPPVAIGLIEGAADGLASILKLASGIWSDRKRSRTPLLAIGYALAAASRGWIGVAGSPLSILGARLLDRTGKGIRSAPRDAMISDVTPPDQRGRAFGFHRAMDHTGAIVGPLLALLLLNGFHIPMRQVFLIAVIPGAIAVVLILALLRDDRKDASNMEAAAAPVTVTRLPRSFWRVITAIALFSIANSSDAFLLLQAHVAGVSTGLLPLLWAAHHVVKSLFSTWAGALSDRHSRRALLGVGWLSYAAIYALFPAVHTLPLFFALFFFYAIPFTLTEGAERALIAELVPAMSRGRSFGIYYLTTGLGVLAGSVIFGLLYQSVSPAAAFHTGAVLAVAAALAIVASRPGLASVREV